MLYRDFFLFFTFFEIDLPSKYVHYKIVQEDW
jgi:hypothetical protein